MSKYSPTQEEIELAASILSKLEPGLLPIEIFGEITRIWVTAIIEIVPLRLSSAKAVEVLLLERPKDDPNWPGMLHTPGTVLRATDVSTGIEGAFYRIFSDEIGAGFVAPTHIKTIFHEENRGVALANVYYVDLGEGQPKNGEWYSLDRLPSNLIDSQLGFIKLAANQFKLTKSKHE